jgi:hypothetical protein
MSEMFNTPTFLRSDTGLVGAPAGHLGVSSARTLRRCEPVDFHLPFNDGEPTALLIPIQGRHAGHGYVFRGGNGKWWSRPLQTPRVPAG